MATAAARERHRGDAGGRARAAATSSVDWSVLDAVVLSTLEDKVVHRKLRSLERLELQDVRVATEQAVSRHKRSIKAIGALDLHQRLVDGLSGEALLVSASMFLDTLQDAERFFDLSFKTIKSKLGRNLDTSSSEVALRAARVTTAAADLFGSFDAARRYLRTKNFALGGATPLELLRTAEGERLVTNELHAQAESGPL